MQDNYYWQVTDGENRLIGEYATFEEAIEVASMLEASGLRCDIRKKEIA